MYGCLAAETIKKTSIDEENIIEILKQGALKANQAMESTKEMLSKKGVQVNLVKEVRVI